MNQLAPIQTSNVIDFSPNQLGLIKRTVAKDLSNDEFDVFMSIATGNGLNPFKKQIYAIVYNKNKPDKRNVTYITSIIGYRSIASRSGAYRPDEDAPRIHIDESLKDPKRNPLGIEYAEVTVHKFGPDGKWYPITGRAYWEELAPLKDDPDCFEYVDTGEVWRDSGKPKKTRRLKEGRSLDRVLDTTGNWGSMPKVMLAKCAEADALRKGWPEDLGNLYITEEMDQANTIDLTATEIVEEDEKQKRQAALGGPGVNIAFELSEGSEHVPYGEFVDRCLAFLNENEDADAIKYWLEFNRAAFRQFWGHAKGDALELRKQIDQRIAVLTPAEEVAAE